MKPIEGHQIIRIDDLQISRESCTIVEGEREVKVTPRSMDVLVYLLEHRGRVVSPDELLDQFWSPLASDHAVHKAIAELRAAMGDSVRQQRYLKTVPKRGYKLLPPSQAADPAETAVSPTLLTARLQHRLTLKGWPRTVVWCLCSVMLIGLGMLVEARREAVASVVVVETAPLCRINTGGEGYLLLVSVVQTDAGTAPPLTGLSLRHGDLRDGREVAACAGAPLMDATGG